MTGEVSVLLRREERERLGELADVLIPGGGGLPSASEAHLTEDSLDRVLSHDPTLSETLTDVAGLGGPAETVVEDLRCRDRNTYKRLVFAVSSAYFMVPRVRRALGYPGIAPRPYPAATDESDYYLADDVLQPVIERGFIYREAP